MDTRFSVAVHILVMVSESDEPLTSDRLAGSTGTNPSYVRKILALLKKARLVDGRRGMGGHRLLERPEEITLLRIYEAVLNGESPCLLDIHQNTNDACIVGRHIQPVLRNMFLEAEQAFARALAQRTLADCIRDIRSELAHQQEESDRRGEHSECSRDCVQSDGRYQESSRYHRTRMVEQPSRYRPE